MSRRRFAQRVLPVPLAAGLVAAWFAPGPAWPGLVAGVAAAAVLGLLPLHDADFARLKRQPAALAGLLLRRWGRLHRYWAALHLLVFAWLAALTLAFAYATGITAVFGGALALWLLLYQQRLPARKRKF